MYTYLLYSCLIYRNVQTVIQYQNKLYIFLVVGLVIFLYWSPYYDTMILDKSRQNIMLKDTLRVQKWTEKNIEHHATVKST